MFAELQSALYVRLQSAPVAMLPSCEGFQHQLDLSRRIPIPTRREQIELGRRIRLWLDWSEGAVPRGIERSGRRALDRLVSGNLRLVLKSVDKARGYGVDPDDLFQAGCLGLIRAARKFDPTRGVSFATYALWWIREEIQQLWTQRCAIRVPLDALRLEAKFRHTCEDLRRTMGREPTMEEVLDALPTHLSKVAVRNAVVRVGRSRLLATVIDGAEDGGENLDMLERLRCPAAGPMEHAERIEVEERVRRAINQLGPRMRPALVRELRDFAFCA